LLTGLHLSRLKLIKIIDLRYSKYR
jgi:hypothetical protein